MCKILYRLYEYEVDITAMLAIQKDLGKSTDSFEIKEESCFYDRYEHTDIQSSNQHSIQPEQFWVENKKGLEKGVSLSLKR